MSRSPITTHILDTSIGRPAASVAVTLERITESGEAVLVAKGVTDADGRLRDLLPASPRPEAGTYRISFATDDYYTTQGVVGFYPSVSITFSLRAPEEHYHVPLLLNPYGFSTYRGS